MAAAKQSEITLPIQVTSRAEVSRLLREIDQVDDFLQQSAIRKPGTALQLPKTSRLLDEMAASNKLNLLVKKDRLRLISFLTAIKSKAPVLHIGLGVDPAPVFVQKLLTWLRSEIHPVLLLHIGLQPSIGAGCTVRGNSAYFDLSLRQHFRDQRSLLIEQLRGEAQAATDAAAAPEAEATVDGQEQAVPQPASAKDGSA